MTDHDIVTQSAEMAGQGLGDEHRAMLAAGTPDGDAQITPLAALEARQPSLQKMADVGDHRADVRLAAEKIDHGRVQSGQRTQLRLPMWIGQATHIEYKIGVGGYAVFEPKRFEQQRHRFAGRLVHAGANQLAQLVEIGVAGIDDQIGAGDDRLQQAPFLLDRFPQRNVAQRQGMPTPGFAVALEQRLVVGLQKQHIHPQVAGAQFGQRGGKPVQFIDEIARVHPHRHGRWQQVAGSGDFPRQGQNQLERQVVDAVVVQVF